MLVVVFRLLESVDVPDCLFSELNTQPTCTPVYASPVHLAIHCAKLGAERFATPYLVGSFIPCFMPVYPGAPQRTKTLIETDGVEAARGPSRASRSGNSARSSIEVAPGLSPIRQLTHQ